MGIKEKMQKDIISNKSSFKNFFIHTGGKLFDNSNLLTNKNIINKYLKYKNKYLKYKNKIDTNKINNIIKLKRIELYNNINNINYEYIKQKYLKYKNKYLLLQK